jgi:hypothetical protein
MGCLPSKRYEIVSQTEFNLTSKTLPLNRIPNEIHFRNIIPSEMNFEVIELTDGQFFLSQANKEIKYQYTPNKKHWTVGRLQAMNYPSHDSNYRITIEYSQYESINKYEHILTPIDGIPELELSITN